MILEQSNEYEKPRSIDDSQCLLNNHSNLRYDKPMAPIPITYSEATYHIIKSSIPSIMSLLFLFLYDNLNIIYVGKFLANDTVSAVGIGTLYINATGFFLGLGLVGGVDTLCSQAYGARSFYLMGAYANICKIVLIVFYILICLPAIMFSDVFLGLFGQSQELIDLTVVFIKSMIPSIFFSLQFYASIHYLQAMNVFLPGMLITLFTAILHNLWLFVLVGLMDTGVRGVGWAMGITNMLNYAMISYYIHYYNPEPATYLQIDEHSVKFKRIWEYLKMAISSSIIFSADWLGFHILILFSSYLNTNYLVANISVFNFILLVLTIPLGISFAACILVGNSMGSNQVHNAKVYSVMSSIIGFVCVLIFLIIALRVVSAFPYIYSNDENIVAIFSRVLNFMIYFAPLDSIQIILNSILKGLGKQRSASFLVLFVLYPINIPMCMTISFTLNYGLIGLWYSQITSVIFLIFAYVCMVICIDWENSAKATIYNFRKISTMLVTKGKILESKRQITD